MPAKPFRLSWAISVLACLLASSAAGAAEWHVAPQGKPDGAGTRGSPWDLESALLGKHPIEPGDTILLASGTYRRRPREQFEVKLAGAEGKPIHVRPAPGSRARIDGGLAVLEPSAHLRVWGLEIFVSEPQPQRPVGPGSHPRDFTRPWGGLNIHGGKHCKYINLVIHDCRQGVSFWSGARDCELYGCVIYDNGWPATDRGHGHAIYTQNDEGTKTIADCIMTGGHGYTLHAYGSSRASVNNYLVRGNICYNTGTFLIGGGKPSRGIRVLDNVLYRVSMQVGYSAPYNEDCEVRGNRIVDGNLAINKYRKVVNEGNAIFPKGKHPDEQALTIVRPSKYEPGRGHLVVLNWQKKATVGVDLGGMLKRGDKFRLMDPRKLWGTPVLTGTYDGKVVRVPMAGEFAAFVVLRGLGE
jgi:hypothetical protein